MIKIRTHKSKIISIFCGIILLVIINGNNFRYGLLTNENIYNDNEIDLKKAGYPDLYKYNKIWGGNGEESFHDVDYDIEGNIYVTGYTASYGAGDDDIVLLKYDPLGNLLWNQTWGTINLDRPEAICVDNESNIYITGYTKIPDAHIYDKQEMIILKFNSTGHLKWAKQETFGSDHGERGLGIILDNQNNIIICGFQYIGSTDAREIILVKYNSTGDQQWFKTWSAGASSLVYGEDLVLDKDGNFFVTGYRYNPGDMILVKFDSSGNYQWNKLWSWTSRNVGKSISIDNESNYLYCAGYSLDGGGVFLVKYDLDGNIISEIKGFGGYDPIYDGANSLAFKLNDTIRLNIDIDDLNNIYIPTFNSTYKNGLNDLILYKFNEDLEQITNHSWGGFSDDYGFGIAINSEENELCIVGKTYSFGNGSADGVLISYSDDSIAPEITIVNPISNDLFGSSAPDYDLTVTDANLDSIWYTLDGGSTNSTPVSTNGTIDQAMWNAVGNGTVTIRFYANDTLGNINYEEIIMLKDIIEPSIAFNSPNPNDLFVSSAPDYDLTVTDANLQSIWYTLDGGATNSTPVSDSGTIDQAMWNAVGNGTVTIRFYAIDTVGNLKNEEVIVYKDIIEPSIAINIPNPNDLFGSKAPNYDLTIIEGNLDSIWYTLDGGLINSTFVSDSGIIDQAMWNTQPNGTVIIRFYAND